MENTDIRNLEPGQKLVLTDYGITQGMQRQATTSEGTFLGVSKKGWLRVRRDGIRTIEHYSPVFWNLSLFESLWRAKK